MKSEDTATSPSGFTVLSQKNRVLLIFVGSVVLIGYIGLNIFVYQYAKKTKKNEPTLAMNTQVLPTPTPLPLTSAGVYQFSISGGSEGPKLISKGVLNPVDPPVGGQQNLEVTTVNGAEHIVAIIKTDTKEKTIALSKSGSNPTVWQGSWTMDDQYSYIYTIEVKGSVGGKETVLPITFR